MVAGDGASGRPTTFISHMCGTSCGEGDSEEGREEVYIANEHIPVKKTAPSPRQAINLEREKKDIFRERGQKGRRPSFSKEERK